MGHESVETEAERRDGARGARAWRAVSSSPANFRCRCFHCYTADAEVAKSARLPVVFSCIDDTRMESVECIVARMSKWPDGDKMHIEL